MTPNNKLAAAFFFAGGFGVAISLAALLGWPVAVMFVSALLMIGGFAGYEVK